MKHSRSAWFGAVLLFGAGLSPVIQAEEKRKVTPEDLVRIRGVGDVQISPDGTRSAFVVTEPADPRKPEQPGDSNIWLVPTDGSEPARPFALSPKSDTSPRWSPDGRLLAFLSKRGEPAGEEKEGKKEATNQVFLLRTDGGEAEQLTAFRGEVERLRWSPSGEAIAFLVKDPRTEEEEKREKERDDAILADRDHKFTRLWVMSLKDRKAEPVTRQDLQVNDFAWSPAGDEFAVGVSPTPRLDDVLWHSSLVVVRRLTGEVVRTLSDRLSIRSGRAIDWSPDGRTIFFFEFTPRGIAAWPALAPAEGGPVRHLLKEHPGTLWRAQWAADSKHLLAVGNEGTRARLYGIDAESGAIQSLLDIHQRSPDFSSSADGRTIAYVDQPPAGPGDVWCWTRSHREPPRRLTDLHPQVSSLLLGSAKEITWKNKKDGKTLYGALITPPDFKPGQSCPTVVQVHGGPQWAWWLGWHGSWHDWGQFLASNGYAVFLPNPRGSTGQGVEFAEANIDDWGGMDFLDVMDGVERLVEEKVADPDRLGIGGWSYGGFLTAWTVTQTDRFKAAVVGAAVTNLLSFNGTTDITPTFLRTYFRDLPFRRRSAYDSHSPLTFLQNVKTPSLVLHGQADERVPVGQGWEFYNGLKALGVETEMVIYPREAHGIGERAHQLDLLKRLLAFYDRHLKREIPRP